MSRLRTPIVAVVTGEGGSGGALATAVADRVYMMENTVYSVISPEGCASIMWRDATKKEIAAEALKITSDDLLRLGIIDGIIAEPNGGAHSDHAAAAQLVGDQIESALNELRAMSTTDLLNGRYDKFRNIAQFYRATAAIA